MVKFIVNFFLNSFPCVALGLILLGLISNLRGGLYTTPPESGKTVLAISLSIAFIYTIIQQKRKRDREKMREQERKRRESEQEKL